jgi:hypothetical protein
VNAWLISTLDLDRDVEGRPQLIVGLTTEDEWYQNHDDGERAGGPTTFVWVVLDETGHLIQIGLRPDDRVSDHECLGQITALLALARPWDGRELPTRLLGRKLEGRP